MVDETDAYPLCEECATRQGNEGAHFDLVNAKSCFICRGLTARAAKVGEKTLRKAKRYQFKTFSIGMILPSGVQEREDRLRSDLKIRGRETIKSELSGQIARLVEGSMHKTLDHLHPDLTALVNLDSGSICFTTKSIFVYGRYTKPRGIPQRRYLCNSCWGRGCDRCDLGYAKIPSVEMALGNRLGRVLRSPRVKFTWLGSEDPESVVFAPGRPFVAEVKSPMKHAIPSRFSLRTGAGLVTATFLRRLDGKPTTMPAFTFATRALLESDLPTKPAVPELEKIREMTVRYKNNKNKTVFKKVHRLKVLKTRGRRMIVEIKLDGGLPVKRFVTGDSVSPSISEVLKTPISCQRFDILRVWESGGFKFGKV